MKISVIVTTYNRCDTVCETLRCISRQEIPTDWYEVILADDGSSDETVETVEKLAPSLPFRLSILTHPNTGPGYTQNRGIRAASGQLILLIADDIHLQPGALAAHLAAHAANPSPNIAVLGKVVQSPLLPDTVFMRNWDLFSFSDFEGEEELGPDRFWACNISCKRDFLLEHGMFLEERGRGGAASHEDVELGYRLKSHGLRILYAPKALGHHFHVETMEKACRRAFERGVNWHDFRRLVDSNEASVLYHVLNRETFGDFISYYGKLPLASRMIKFAAIGMKKMARTLMFNRCSVNFIWRPFLASAENVPAIANFVTPWMYRQTVAHYFFRGVREFHLTSGVRRG